MLVFANILQVINCFLTFLYFYFCPYYVKVCISGWSNTFNGVWSASQIQQPTSSGLSIPCTLVQWFFIVSCATDFFSHVSHLKRLMHGGPPPHVSALMWRHPLFVAAVTCVPPLTDSSARSSNGNNFVVFGINTILSKFE
jgi:hypothetical protein